jgi:hypothetical protein
LGDFAVLPSASSQRIIAGSVRIARKSVWKSPPPSVRIVWFCLSISDA